MRTGAARWLSRKLESPTFREAFEKAKKEIETVMKIKQTVSVTLPIQDEKGVQIPAVDVESVLVRRKKVTYEIFFTKEDGLTVVVRGAKGLPSTTTAVDKTGLTVTVKVPDAH